MVLRFQVALLVLDNMAQEVVLVPPCLPVVQAAQVVRVVPGVQVVHMAQAGPMDLMGQWALTDQWACKGPVVLPALPARVVCKGSQADLTAPDIHRFPHHRHTWEEPIYRDQALAPPQVPVRIHHPLHLGILITHQLQILVG